MIPQHQLHNANKKVTNGAKLYAHDDNSIS